MDYNKLKKSVQRRLDKRLSEHLETYAQVNESEETRDVDGKIALCITVPKNISWSDYEKELADVCDGNMEMNYKLSSYPKRIAVGDRCYVVHNGMIRGWMTITGIEQRDESFKCETTGRIWNSGVYVKRSGPFHDLSNPVPMKGFMGYRYIREID